MDILVVGGGGREHAIIMKLAESKKVGKLYCTPGNGGISKYAQCFDVAATDIDGVVALAKKLGVDMVAVAPDDPLVLGMVDALQAAGFKTFGPKKDAAIIEGSKVFSKELMKKYNIPTAAYEVFDNSAEAIAYVKKQNTYPAVIKADGLALGKGVILAQNEQEAVEAIHSMIDELKFGKSSSTIVVEEFLTGPEVSVLSFTDGKTVVPMISSMDHKRALDCDLGLNTGGMGTVAPNPYYTEDIAKECMEKIFLPTINAMNAEGRTFEGCLYFGLMLTPKGGWKEGYCTCVVMASGGYPTSYKKGYEITGLDDKGQVDGAFVYHAGTKLEGGKFTNNGGRVLGVTCTALTLQGALDKSYEAVSKINWEDVHYRKDIGQRALKALDSGDPLELEYKEDMVGSG